jgi:hypothetical protein
MLEYQPPSSQIRFPCPQTNELLDFQVQTDADSLAQVWMKNIRVSCPHCGIDHEFNVRDAYLDHILNTAGARLAVR